MAGVLDTVDQRTRLVGENRLEILLFQLAGPQLFALNVFKIREVLTLPALTQMPQRHPNVVGVIHLRGQTIPVIDLSGAIGLQPQAVDANSTIIVTEYKDCLAGGVAEEAVVTPSSTSFSSCYRDQRSASPLDPVDSGQPSPPQYSPAATGPLQAGSRPQLEEDNHHLVNRFNTIQIADYGQKGSLSGLGGCEEYMAGVNNPLSPPVSSVDIDNILERELQRLQGSNSNLNFIDQSFVHL